LLLDGSCKGDEEPYPWDDKLNNCVYDYVEVYADSYYGFDDPFFEDEYIDTMSEQGVLIQLWLESFGPGTGFDQYDRREMGGRLVEDSGGDLFLNLSPEIWTHQSATSVGFRHHLTVLLRLYIRIR
jgi:hypothetical protein